MVTVKQILFKLGKEEYGLDIFDVEAIERNVPILRVPTAPKHIAGIIQLRGEAIPVYDLRARFGMPSGGTELLIIARMGGMKVALAVDDVSEIIEAEENEIIAAPTLVKTANTAFVSKVTNVKGHMFIMLDLEGLMTEQEKKEVQEMLRGQKQEDE